VTFYQPLYRFSNLRSYVFFFRDLNEGGSSTFALPYKTVLPTVPKATSRLEIDSEHVGKHDLTERFEGCRFHRGDPDSDNDWV